MIEGEVRIDGKLRSKVVVKAKVALVRRHREVIIRMIGRQVGQEAPLLHPVKGG